MLARIQCWLLGNELDALIAFVRTLGKFVFLPNEFDEDSIVTASHPDEISVKAGRAARFDSCRCYAVDHGRASLPRPKKRESRGHYLSMVDGILFVLHFDQPNEIVRARIEIDDVIEGVDGSWNVQAPQTVQQFDQIAAWIKQ